MSIVEAKPIKASKKKMVCDGCHNVILKDVDKKDYEYIEVIEYPAPNIKMVKHTTHFHHTGCLFNYIKPQLHGLPEGEDEGDWESENDRISKPNKPKKSKK